jgi:flagellar motility protein MotE (MotC chaperone)
MHILPHPVRVLPLTLIVAGLLLVVKLVEVASVLGDISTGAMPIAAAHAEATRLPPAAPALPPSQPASPPQPAWAGPIEGATHADAGPRKTRPVAQVSGKDGPSTTPSPQEVAILEQLAGRRQALDTREQELERKSDLLRAAETRLDQKLQQMKELESSLTRLIKVDDEQQQAKLRSLVKIYENMKPKDAARIFEELDMDTLLPVAERMNERKLAPVMAEMNPGKAKEITQELGKRRQVASGARPGGAS